jgi:hypothetical protein
MDKEIREERINDLLADCHGEDENSSAWFYYLAEEVTFPFNAKCIKKLSNSPLKENEEVEVIDIDCDIDIMKGIFAQIKWEGRDLSVPFEQLLPIDTDEESLEIIKDWHYWVEKGYHF